VSESPGNAAGRGPVAGLAGLLAAPGVPVAREEAVLLAVGPLVAEPGDPCGANAKYPAAAVAAQATATAAAMIAPRARVRR
jgi:hypothetical protein